LNIEPLNLGIPLHRRDFSRLWNLVLAGFVAWLWHRPMAIPQAAISFFIGGGFLWFVFHFSIGHPIARHRIPLVRGLWFSGAALCIALFMRHAIPYLHALA
jgi:hypothetical protein